MQTACFYRKNFKSYKLLNMTTKKKMNIFILILFVSFSTAYMSIP